MLLVIQFLARKQPRLRKPQGSSTRGERGPTCSPPCVRVYSPGEQLTRENTDFSELLELILCITVRSVETMPASLYAMKVSA